MEDMLTLTPSQATTSTSTSVTTISSVVMTATTVTVTAAPTAPASFYLFDGTNDLYGGNFGPWALFSSDTNNATLYTYNPGDGTLSVLDGEYVLVVGSGNPAQLGFSAAPPQGTPLTCALNVGTEYCTLECTGNPGQTENSLQSEEGLPVFLEDTWYIGTPGTTETAGTEFTIYVVDPGSLT